MAKRRTKRLTHLGKRGEARMVDVSGKASTERVAIAEGRVRMRPATLALVKKGNAKKGDVLGAARLAGIMAAKRTHELIPLCHPLALSKVSVDIEPVRSGVSVRATVSTRRSGTPAACSSSNIASTARRAAASIAGSSNASGA